MSNEEHVSETRTTDTTDAGERIHTVRKATKDVETVYPKWVGTTMKVGGAVLATVGAGLFGYKMGQRNERKRMHNQMEAVTSTGTQTEAPAQEAGRRR